MCKRPIRRVSTTERIGKMRMKGKKFLQRKMMIKVFIRRKVMMKEIELLDQEMRLAEKDLLALL
jgi:hypothetical protein